MEYNTVRNQLIMREYGRNIQKMIEYVLTIEDPQRRQDNAMAVIELMGILNPHLRNVEDFRHKLWDHLFLISGFHLEVESPYPIPTRETLKNDPDPLPYPKRHPRYKHFGRNLEMIIDKALIETDPEKREGFTQTIGNYMKLAYTNWHKESVHDDMIKNELAAITENQLVYQNTYTFGNYTPDNTFRPHKRRNFQPRPNGNIKSQHGGNKNINFKHNKFSKNRSK